jgi:hypothetical protein
LFEEKPIVEKIVAHEQALGSDLCIRSVAKILIRAA